MPAERTFDAGPDPADSSASSESPGRSAPPASSARSASSAAELVVTRTFAAPRPLVFAAWTEAAHFSRWFGPHGTSVPYCELDARVGGTLRFCHRHATGEELWIGGRYLEVDPPARLVFTAHFTDEAGLRIERPGFALETRVTVGFTDEAGGTRVTVRHVGLTVDQGESQGWSEALERLAEHLAQS